MHGRSFHFDENMETLDAYVMHIRQVAALLGYGKPQVLEVFRNTVPMRLYWVCFPTEDLRLLVETAKKILTKEKLDRQLVGQSSSTPFMNIRDGYSSKKVVMFDTQDRLDNKIDKLTSVKSKLTAQSSSQIGSLNPKFIEAKGEDKQEIIMIRANIKIDTSKIIEIEECHIEVELSMDKIIEEGSNMIIIIEMTLGEETFEKNTKL